VTEPPLLHPSQDWHSPEFGEAIRTILDVHSSIGQPQHVVAERFARLGVLVREQPDVVVGAFFALLNAALGLPELLPSSSPNAPEEIREQLERKVYGDIDEMPPGPG
jgi:hypothetical protein